MMSLRFIMLVGGALSVLIPQPLWAQGTRQAQEAFDRGLAEMMAGRYETGCPALAQSYEIDPQPGALFTLAACEQKWGKLASALAHYEQYLSVFSKMTSEEQTSQHGRQQVAETQQKELSSSVPRLTITLQSAPASTVITHDGRPFDTASLGVAIAVDPGEHVIVAKTPDGGTFEERVTLALGQSKAVAVHIEPIAPKKQEPVVVRPDSEPVSQRTWAYVAGGVGIAGLAFGAVTGLLAVGRASTVDTHCPNRLCDDEGLDAVSSGQTLALMSTIGFGVGAAGLAAGTILFLTSPSSTASTTQGQTLKPAKRMLVTMSGTTRGPFLGVTGVW